MSDTANVDKRRMSCSCCLFLGPDVVDIKDATAPVAVASTRVHRLDGEGGARVVAQLPPCHVMPIRLREPSGYVLNPSIHT